MNEQLLNFIEKPMKKHESTFPNLPNQIKTITTETKLRRKWCNLRSLLLFENKIIKMPDKK